MKGWWVASDGKLYPPELRDPDWYPPQTPPRGVLVGLTILCGIIMGFLVLLSVLNVVVNGWG